MRWWPRANPPVSAFWAFADLALVGVVIIGGAYGVRRLWGSL